MKLSTISIPQLNSDSNLGLARALLLLMGILALLGMLYLTQSSQATMTGTRVMELQARLERLRRENAQLEYEIAVLTAPEKIAARAWRLGLRPATITQTMTFVVREYPALPPKPAAAPSAARAAYAADPLQQFWNDLLARLGLLMDQRTLEASPSER